VSPRAGDPVVAWESLFRAQVAVMRQFGADDTWGELSMREYDVLFNLSRAGGGRLRLHELNDQLLISQPSLSRMVDRLAARDLVRREGEPGDRRTTVVCLTDAGRALQRSVGSRHAASIRRHVGSALTREELAQLNRLTEKLRLAQR
jgi:DNA-binding MarR family transcriptional regulator